MTTEPHTIDSPDARLAGVVILAATVVLVAVTLHHPTVSSHGVGEYVEELAAEAPINGAVHGAAIVALGAFALGYWGLASALGLRRVSVRAGAVAFGLAALTNALAALLSGFVMPGLAGRWSGESPAEGVLPALQLAGELQRAVAVTGMVSWALAAFFWSIALARHCPWRITGVLAALVVLAPVGALAAGWITMNLHGFGVFAAALGLWSVAAAVWLVRGAR